MQYIHPREIIIGAGGVFLLLLLVMIYALKKDTGLFPSRNESVMCTMEARQCPDGSYVGRVGPSCDFAACPSARPIPVPHSETNPPQAPLVPIHVFTASSTASSTATSSDAARSTASSATTMTATTSHKVYTVTYTDRGFSPATTTIILGETVRFANNSNTAFWPASDPHPEHTDHPDFDPGNSIITSGIYEYSFSATGTWGYHNHVKPQHTGVVIVK